jgi:LacI family transcriptional regulator
MNTQNKPTLKQIAGLANVSVSTASMVLNQKKGVSFSDDTVSRVRLAADSLGYMIPSASPFGSFQNKVVAIFLPDIAGNYYTSMAKAAAYSASQKGYDTIYFETNRDRLREQRGLSYIQSGSMAGLLFTYIPHNIDLVESLSHQMPAVIIGNRNADMKTDIKLDMIETDSYRAGELMAQYMLDLGHRHVAFLATSLEWWGYSSTQRIQGVRDTFAKAGPNARLTEKIKQVSGSIAEDSKEMRRNIGRELAEECLDDSTLTGFITVNDYLAYGVTDALAARGRRIPEDYSVCGCDDIFSSSLPGVNLTTVNHHVREKGMRAFDMLYRRIIEQEGMSNGQEAPVSIMRVEYLSTLMVRGSVSAPRTP